MDLANEIALMVCRQCLKSENESDVDFSSRLLNVYYSCYENVDELVKKKNKPDLDKSIESFLRGR